VAKNVVELVLSIEGRTVSALVAIDGSFTWIAHRGTTSWWRLLPPRRRDESSVDHDGEVHSPMPGVVIHVGARPGDEVSLGDPLLVVEAMKMEYPLRAPITGQVADVLVQLGDQVVLDQVVARVRAHAPDDIDVARTPNDRTTS
jgi:acetyl-CoA/propionyl-CoA carboxylase biotin carboxyl carrier protein